MVDAEQGRKVASTSKTKNSTALSVSIHLPDLIQSTNNLSYSTPQTDIIMAPPIYPEHETLPTAPPKPSKPPSKPAPPRARSPLPLLEVDAEEITLPNIEDFTVQTKGYDVIVESPKVVRKTVAGQRLTQKEMQKEVEAKHGKSVSFVDREEGEGEEGEDMDVTAVEALLEQQQYEEGEDEGGNDMQLDVVAREYPPLLSSPRLCIVDPTPDCICPRPAMSAKARGKQRAVDVQPEPLDERPFISTPASTFVPRAGLLNLHSSMQPSRLRPSQRT